ncbi:MAG: DUF222 domain-containing protein [Pseudomonadota bacterium]
MNPAESGARAFEPMERLEAALVDAWRQTSRAMHRFLTVLREFDFREGWRAYGNNDCAEWLDWRCGISRTTAQEKLRVARALAELPQIDRAFETGALSYSKVRALTRVATPDSETKLLDFALGTSASQLEQYCRRLRNGDAQYAAAEARRLQDGRWLSRSFREDGFGVLYAELPREELELVVNALELVGSRLPEAPGRSLFAKAADALVQMARETLTTGSHGNTDPDDYRVVVHVDADALGNGGGQSDLPVPTVRRLCCDGAVVPVIKNSRGQPLSVGRRKRTLSTAIKRALHARDRSCTFPGCHHRRFLEAHHVRHWAEGGETSLDNLLLVCWTHHKLLHEGGFDVARHPDGGYYFVRPDGRPVEAPVPGVAEVRTRYRTGPPSAEDTRSRTTPAMITHSARA